MLLFTENGVVRKVVESTEVTREALTTRLSEIEAEKVELQEAIEKFDRLTSPAAAPAPAPAPVPEAPTPAAPEAPAPTQATVDVNGQPTPVSPEGIVTVTVDTTPDVPAAPEVPAQ
jgi:ribosomal protein L12E/L44/L45/RPP1/RPP2